MRRVAAQTAIALAMMWGACDSNPTPHPQSDATSFDARGEDQTPGVTTPENIDNAADCTSAGAFWDGDACRGSADSVDAEVEIDGDVVAPIADGVDPDATDDGDIINDLGDSGPDIGD